MAPAGELSRPRGSLPRSALRPSSHGPCSWPRGQTRGAGARGWPRPHLPPPPCSTGSSFQGSLKGTGTASAEGPADAASLLSGTSWSQNAGLTSAGLSGRSRGATGVSQWERGQHRPEGRVTELGPGRPGVGSCPGLLRSCLPGLSFPSVAPGQASGSRPLWPPHTSVLTPRILPGPGGPHLPLSRISSRPQHVLTPQPSA